jgi:methyltransferase
VIPLVIAAATFAPMLAEAALSARHERLLRAGGATEPPDDVIGLMQWAYPTAFACVVVEAWLRRVSFDAAVVSGAMVFLVAKGLKYWAISTLGTRWTFRVLVPPRSVAIRSGPYAWLRHPNYIAVIGELIGASLMAHAWVTGPLVTLGFGLLIVARIRVEERALGLRFPR